MSYSSHKNPANPMQHSPASFYRGTSPRAQSVALSRALFRRNEIESVDRSRNSKQSPLLARHGIHPQSPPAPANQHRTLPPVLRRKRERNLQTRPRRNRIFADEVKPARGNIAQMGRARLREIR